MFKTLGCSVLVLALCIAYGCVPSENIAGGLNPDTGATTETSNGTTSTSNATTATSNGTTATSNGTTSTSNGTTATSNGTTATSNGTTSTSNGTTFTSNGTTATSNGTTATSNGTTGDCVPEDEVCDGIDNDCDEDVDEDNANLFASCQELEGATTACVDGACDYSCDDARADRNNDLNAAESDGCECTIMPEVCDGLDNDCDSDVDEEGPELLAECDEPSNTNAVCRDGACAYTCNPEHADLNSDLEGEDSDGCECAIMPEVCDGIDSDCDGEVDEENFDLLSVCMPTSHADIMCGDGVCNYQCEVGWVDLNSDLGELGSDGCECRVELEVCDGIDNDCNGEIDEENPDLLSVCEDVVGADAACDQGACAWACLPERFDIDADLEQRGEGTGCECTSGEPGCDTCPFVTGCVSGTPEDYNFEVPGSYINTIAIEFDSGIGADLNGDGFPDNAFGELMANLVMLLDPNLNLNAVIAGEIQREQIAVGVAWPTLTGAVSDASGLDVDLFDLVRSNGGGWLATRDSFIPESQTPFRRFTQADVVDGRLRATEGDFRIALSSAGFPLIIALENVEMEADLSDDASGIALANGTLAGALPLQTFLNIFNGLLDSSACACLGLEEPLFNLSRGSGAAACTSTPNIDMCVSDAEQICVTLALSCPFLVPAVVAEADVDRDGDGTLDALSAYLYFSAVGANIEGVAP